jgi:hypothetical protein
MKKRTFLKGLVAFTAATRGQRALAADNPRAMIKLATPGMAQPPATLADVAWLEGTWLGGMPDGPVEQVFQAPMFGQMPSFVRAWNKRGIIFYEIAMFVEAKGSLTLRLKHFTSALAGWEDKESYIERPLIAREHDRLYFHRATYVRTGADSYTVYFLNMDGDREQDTLVIPFRRR